MQAQANLLKIMFRSPIGLRMAQKENQVAEFWCGHSDGSSQLSFRCSQKHKLATQQLPLEEDFIFEIKNKWVLFY